MHLGRRRGTWRPLSELVQFVGERRRRGTSALDELRQILCALHLIAQVDDQRQKLPNIAEFALDRAQIVSFGLGIEQEFDKRLSLPYFREQVVASLGLDERIGVMALG